jgi:5-methylcytosine-specific restriction protein A
MPYLEVHHIKRLADKGSDTTTNSIAVCPNCHRELHYGDKATDKVDALYETIGRLVKE